MLIVTSNGIPGYRIEAVLGEVMGMTVRSANLGKNISASFRSLGGGEVPEYTQLVYESRNEVMNRMWSECIRRGGNAVVAMRFDNGEIANNFSEVCAYGTAVVVTPIPEGEPGATPQSVARAAAANPGPGNWPRMEGQQLPAEGAVPAPMAEGQRHQAQAAEGQRPQAPMADGQRHQAQPAGTDDRPRRAEGQPPNADGSWLDLN